MKKIIALFLVFFCLTSTSVKSQDVLDYTATLFKSGIVDDNNKTTWGDPKEVNLKITIQGRYIKIYNEARTILRQTTDYEEKTSEVGKVIYFYANDEKELRCKVTIGYITKSNRYILIVEYSDVAYAFYMYRNY